MFVIISFKLWKCHLCQVFGLLVKFIILAFLKIFEELIEIFRLFGLLHNFNTWSNLSLTLSFLCFFGFCLTSLLLTYFLDSLFSLLSDVNFINSFVKWFFVLRFFGIFDCIIKFHDCIILVIQNLLELFFQFAGFFFCIIITIFMIMSHFNWDWFWWNYFSDNHWHWCQELFNSLVYCYYTVFEALYCFQFVL